MFFMQIKLSNQIKFLPIDATAVECPVDSLRSGLETDLKVEREWRGTLQKNLEREKGQLTKINAELSHLSGVKKVS